MRQDQPSGMMISHRTTNFLGRAGAANDSTNQQVKHATNFEAVHGLWKEFAGTGQMEGSGCPATAAAGFAAPRGPALSEGGGASRATI
jgi:hypothetical protein